MSDPQPKNWAHSALLLMDEVESLISFGCANAPAEKYETAAKAFWSVSHMLATERARLEQPPAVEADRLDAKRYRFMRDPMISDSQHKAILHAVDEFEGEQMDAAIDAAMRAFVASKFGDEVPDIKETA